MSSLRPRPRVFARDRRSCLAIQRLDAGRLVTASSRVAAEPEVRHRGSASTHRPSRLMRDLAQSRRPRSSSHLPTPVRLRAATASEEASAVPVRQRRCVRSEGDASRHSSETRPSSEDSSRRACAARTARAACDHVSISADRYSRSSSAAAHAVTSPSRHRIDPGRHRRRRPSSFWRPHDHQPIHAAPHRPRRPLPRAQGRHRRRPRGRPRRRARPAPRPARHREVRPRPRHRPGVRRHLLRAAAHEVLARPRSSSARSPSRPWSRTASPASSPASCPRPSSRSWTRSSRRTARS